VSESPSEVTAKVMTPFVTGPFGTFDNMCCPSMLFVRLKLVKRESTIRFFSILHHTTIFASIPPSHPSQNVYLDPAWIELQFSR